MFSLTTKAVQIENNYGKELRRKVRIKEFKLPTSTWSGCLYAKSGLQNMPILGVGILQ